MKHITIWSIITEDGKIKHNHIQDGWVFDINPQPKSNKFTNQKAWVKLNWIGKFAYLDDENKVVLN